MVVESLSLDAINAVSPYIVKVTNKGEALSFVTDYDVEIFITFEKDDLLHKGVVYQFGISNPKRVRSPRDPKVRETVLAIVEEFLQRTRLLSCMFVKLVMVFKECGIACSAIGLEYMVSEKIMCSCLRQYMMKKVTIIMRL